MPVQNEILFILYLTLGGRGACVCVCVHTTWRPDIFRYLPEKIADLSLYFVIHVTGAVTNYLLEILLDFDFSLLRLYGIALPLHVSNFFVRFWVSVTFGLYPTALAASIDNEANTIFRLVRLFTFFFFFFAFLRLRPKPHNAVCAKKTSRDRRRESEKTEKRKVFDGSVQKL